MFHAFIHWFNVEYWSMSWPNVFAPSFWTILGLLIADYRNHRRHNEFLDTHASHITVLTGQVRELTDKLHALIGNDDDDE